MTRKKPQHYRKIGGLTGPMNSGLYLSPSKLDGRTWPVKDMNKIAKALLEGFPDPPPARAQIIAQLASVKIFQVNCYKSNILAGIKDLHESSEIYCLTLMNSITRDIIALDQMAKNHAPKNNIPTLQQYLQEINNGKMIPTSGDDEEMQ